MENGICSLREIEKLCRNDIRYMYLLDGMKTPSFATFGNLIRNELTDLSSRYLKTLIHIFLPKITWICSIHTLTGQKLRQMPIDIPGYGKNRV